MTNLNTAHRINRKWDRMRREQWARRNKSAILSVACFVLAAAIMVWWWV